MAVSEGYKEYVIDQLSGWRPVYVRRMFGGAGVYHDGHMFALIADDTLYLKVDQTNRHRFAEANMNPFSYERNGRRGTLPYYRCPDNVIEDPEQLVAWAESAWLVALRAGHAKKKRRTGTRLTDRAND